jgi:hypothetical protein
MITVGKSIPADLLEQLEAHGFHWLDGVAVSDDDASCQAILDSYDPVPRAKKLRIAAIKADGLSRINSIMPAIGTFDELMLVRELWLSIKVASKSATPTMQAVIDIYQAGATAIGQVRAAATVAAVEAVVVAWP